MSDADDRSNAQTPDADDEESPRSRTGRFYVQHRGGARVEVGEPIHCGGEKPWLCAVKLVGRKGPELDADATQTLLVRTGRGNTPEEAQRAALAQITVVYGSPVEPPPQPTIVQLKSDPPPRPDPVPAKKPGFFSRLFRGKR